ncbi:MAG: sigma-70 family RNA polymerase sigma factor [Planctomycetota bacterium]|nr:sigma-70 family RNA polymerase sigma factor [Planctomycetota bacterium]
MKSKADISELLTRRDPNALEDLIAWYRPLLKGMANRDLDRLLRSKIDASDIVQETCRDVARSFPSLQTTSRLQFVAYISTVLKHKIEDVRRRFLICQKRSIYRERPIETVGQHIVNKLVDSDSQPIENLLNQEVCERLNDSVNRLPRELQRVLRWRFRKGMTYKQIGEKLERSDNDVRMLVNRCLARLRSDVFPNGLSV